MPLPQHSIGAYDIFPVGPKLTVAELSATAPKLSRHVQANPGRGIVLDLSGPFSTLPKTKLLEISDLRTWFGCSGQTSGVSECWRECDAGGLEHFAGNADGVGS